MNNSLNTFTDCVSLNNLLERHNTWLRRDTRLTDNVSRQDFQFCSFDHLNLTDYVFEAIEFNNCSFTSCNLTNVKFIDCVLYNCNLTDSNMFNGRIINCDTRKLNHHGVKNFALGADGWQTFRVKDGDLGEWRVADPNGKEFKFDELEDSHRYPNGEIQPFNMYKKFRLSHLGDLAKWKSVR